MLNHLYIQQTIQLSQCAVWIWGIFLFTGLERRLSALVLSKRRTFPIIEQVDSNHARRTDMPDSLSVGFPLREELGGCVN